MARQVIDGHIHIFRRGCLPEQWFTIGAERWAGSKWPSPSPDEIDIESGLIDDDVSMLIPTMDGAGVQSAMCLTLDWGISLGEPKSPLRETHAWYGELQRRFPGRIYASAGCDPRRPDAREILDEALGEHRLKGVKLYPPTGFRVSEEICNPIYEKCLEYDVPLVVHSAFVGYPHVGHHANPLWIGEVQKRYPDLRIVLAHSGFPFWYQEAMEVASHHPNTFLEISNWNMLLAKDPERTGRTLLEMINEVGAHRMIFASDHLGGRRFSGERSRLRSWVEFVSGLSDFAAQRGQKVSEEDLDLIMHDNAARVFKL